MFRVPLLTSRVPQVDIRSGTRCSITLIKMSHCEQKNTANFGGTFFDEDYNNMLIVKY